MSDGDDAPPGIPSRGAVFDFTRKRASDYFRADPAAIGEDTRLMGIEGADSVKLIRLLGAVEERFDIQMIVEDLEIAQTVGELVDQVVAVKSRELLRLGISRIVD
ncbi:acyl carrier protein [Mycobacteroides chelonae]